MKNIIKKLLQWFSHHFLTIVCCVLIIGLGITFSVWSSPGTTTIGENISTTNLTVSGELTVTGTSTFSSNVGIGTTSPSYKLDVDGSIRGNKLRFLHRRLRPLVTFMFDDGLETSYTLMKPLFDAQGEVACSAIITGTVGSGGYMTWAQINELQNVGWEIINHTMTHPHLTTLTEAEIRAEFEDSNSVFRAQGITTNNLVYPWHEQNELVRSIAREYFRAARGGLQGLNQQLLNTYALTSKHADDHTNLASYKTLVNTAESEKRWLIFYLHGTDSDDEAMLNELIDYIQAKNIDIVTMDQALDLAENLIDVGDAISINEQGVRTNFIGNVGIGTTEPFTKLDIITGNGPFLGLKIGFPGTEKGLYMGQVATTLYPYIAGNTYYCTSNTYKPTYTGAGGMRFENTGNISFFADSGLTVNTAYTPSVRMTVKSDGNVGIGTATPDSLLDIYSTATTTLEIDSSSATQGACLKLKDSDGSGYTYCTVKNGAMNCTTTSCE